MINFCYNTIKYLLFCFLLIVNNSCSNNISKNNIDTLNSIIHYTTISDSFSEQVIIQITEDSSFNIYSQNQELMLEFTKQNTDSVSLELLKDIYFSGKYYNER